MEYVLALTIFNKIYKSHGKVFDSNKSKTWKYTKYVLTLHIYIFQVCKTYMELNTGREYNRNVIIFAW